MLYMCPAKYTEMPPVYFSRNTLIGCLTEQVCFCRFAKDGFSFSLNVDDPTVTATTLSDEFKIVETKVGVDRLRLLKAVSNVTTCLIH